MDLCVIRKDKVLKQRLLLHTPSRIMKRSAGNPPPNSDEKDAGPVAVQNKDVEHTEDSISLAAMFPSENITANASSPSGPTTSRDEGGDDEYDDSYLGELIVPRPRPLSFPANHAVLRELRNREGSSSKVRYSDRVDWNGSLVDECAGRGNVTIPVSSDACHTELEQNGGEARRGEDRASAHLPDSIFLIPGLSGHHVVPDDIKVEKIW